MSVEYFVTKYPKVFSDIDLQRLNEQFLNYQLLLKEDIPTEVKKLAKDVEDDPYYHVDILWGYLKGVKTPGTNSLEFDLLFRVAEVVMTIPHSNAGEERIFSLINKKNKTPSRSSLNLNGTLSSLVVVKTHIQDPLNWQPTTSLIEKAKKSTKLYNDKHKSVLTVKQCTIYVQLFYLSQ